MRTSYNVEIASLFRNSRLGIASFPLCSFLLYCSISAVFFFSKFVPVFPTFGGKFVRRKKVLKISWFSALIRGLTSVVTWYFAYVLGDNTRLCKHFSLRSHNKWHFVEGRPASWNNKTRLWFITLCDVSCEPKLQKAITIRICTRQSEMPRNV